MEEAVKSRLRSVQFAEAQVYKNIAIVPLVTPVDGTFQYRTLGEALTSWDVAITEITAAGSIPEVMVVNRGHNPVLLVDGEELAGAKQNRVLNASILLKKVSETKIPVSCSEQGRWSYVSKAFSESGNVMAYKSRSRKTRSVLRSLEASAEYKSDQSEVWHGIDELQAKAGAYSPTSAMSDVYRAGQEDLRKCDNVFKLVPNQIGLVAFIDGQAAGADMVSLKAAYTKLHSKLVRSYALEALLVAPPRPAEASERRGKPGDAGLATPRSALRIPPSDLARAFLEEIPTADERAFPSIGYGTDFRYRSASPQSPSRNPKSAIGSPHSLAGFALVHESEVIHAAFFRLTSDER